MSLADIKSMLPDELGAAMKAHGQPAYRAKQIFSWLHGKNAEGVPLGVSDFNEMSNLPKTLRESLCNNFCLPDVIVKKRLDSSIDNTVKYLYMLSDGQYIESVLMKYKHGYSVCISTQVGCRMGCRFCASGLDGLSRSLTASEMVSQVQMAGRDNSIHISNVVLMGMGEPLDNYENTIRFLDLISHGDALNIGLRHISVSTSGHVEGIYKLMDEMKPVTLSVSLHAPNDEIRSTIMPINRKWNVNTLLTACRDYIKATSRRISFEYAMMDGVNDTDACAIELSLKLKGMLCHVNLIPANPIHKEGQRYRRPDTAKVAHFAKLLNDRGINTTVRRTLGADIDASCGQLRRTIARG